MKLLIAADLHGSLYWTRRVLDLFAEQKADVLVLLGDLYNHGPRNPLPKDYDPIAVSEALAKVSDKILAVQGNCDSRVDCEISKFPIFAETMLFHGGRRLYFTHGDLHNAERLPALSGGDVIFYGHFHVSRVNSTPSGIFAVNVGSASIPKDGVHACCTWQNGEISFIDLENFKQFGFFDCNDKAQQNKHREEKI